MNKYQKKINEIEGKCFKAMPEQLTIDTIEDIQQKLIVNTTEKAITREDIGACSYQVDTILEIFNPVFTKDIQLLNELDHVLNDWLKDAEFVDNVLGIKF